MVISRKNLEKIKNYKMLEVVKPLGLLLINNQRNQRFKFVTAENDD
jgi:hypothetical protein